MSADEAVLERDRVLLSADNNGQFVFEGSEGYSPDDPVRGVVTRGQVTHFGGASFHFRNASATTVIISLDESQDQVTWTPLPFSDSFTAGLLTRTIVGRGEQAILAETDRRYLRVTAQDVEGDAVDAGVMLDLVQRPHRGAQNSATYSYSQ